MKLLCSFLFLVLFPSHLIGESVVMRPGVKIVADGPSIYARPAHYSLNEKGERLAPDVHDNILGKSPLIAKDKRFVQSLTFLDDNKSQQEPTGRRRRRRRHAHDGKNEAVGEYELTAVMDKIGKVNLMKMYCLDKKQANFDLLLTYYRVETPKDCISTCAALPTNYLAMSQVEVPICYCAKKGADIAQVSLKHGANCAKKCNIKGQNIDCGGKESVMLYQLRSGDGQLWSDKVEENSKKGNKA